MSNMRRFKSGALREIDVRDGEPAPGECKAGGSSVDSLMAARIDSDWIVRKLRTNFNTEVVRKLKKAVYSIGQGGRRWFSGGELSIRQASMLLDYTVLVELLLQCRDDLLLFQDELLDCREQLRMQINRFTEGQPERVESVVAATVDSIKQRLAC